MGFCNISNEVGAVGLTPREYSTETRVAGHSESRRQTKWRDDEILLLEELARSGTPTGAIALKLGRSKAAISAKASKLGIKLGATSQVQPVEAELNLLKNEIQDFEALHPNPVEWTAQQLAHYDSLTKRHTKLRAEIAELAVRHHHRQR
jgi:hypothetical protein